MPKHAHFPPLGSTLGCVFFGLVLAALASVLYLIGSPGVQGENMVSLTDAKVERAYVRCRRGRCWLMIAIEVDGKQLELIQHDTPSARGVIKALHPGDTITALASQVSVRPEVLWFWEVRRWGEVLLSYEQTSQEEAARNHSHRMWSFVVGGLSALLLAIGVFNGIKQGVWRTAKQSVRASS